MKVRIKFSKLGEMRFIGHLDLMRFFQKVIRRAGLDIRFSEGMSPHMIMSFASPLGIGLTSRGEYVDIELNTPVTTEEGLARLNAATVEGVTFTDLRQIEEGKAGKAMSLVAAADYELRFRKGHEPAGDWQSDISGFFARDHIEIEKESKKAAKKEAKKKDRGRGKRQERGTQELTADAGQSDSLQENAEPQGPSMTDIRPMIYDMHVNAGTVYMKLASGSAANLKPETVMKAYCDWKEIPTDPFAFVIEREELYADLGKNGKHRFVTLNDLGQIVTEKTIETANVDSQEVEDAPVKDRAF